MTLDNALRTPSRLVAAWKLAAPERPIIAVYATSEVGARLVYEEETFPHAREEVNDLVRARTARLGVAHGGHVWVFDERGAGVWTANASLVEGSRMVIGTRAGGVKINSITRVLTTSDDKSSSVQAHLSDGRVVAVVEAPTGALWTVRLIAQDLAMWLGVPHIAPDGGITNERQLVVAGILRAFANIIETRPGVTLTHEVGTFDGLGSVELRCAPNPNLPSSQYLEAHLVAPSGASARRWLKQGSNVVIGSYLRELRTPDTLLRIVRELSSDVVAR